MLVQVISVNLLKVGVQFKCDTFRVRTHIILLAQLEQRLICYVMQEAKIGV